MKNGTMSGVSCIGSDEIDKSFRESAEFKEQDKQALLRCTPDKRSSLITPLLPSIARKNQSSARSKSDSDSCNLLLVQLPIYRFGPTFFRNSARAASFSDSENIGG